MITKHLNVIPYSGHYTEPTPQGPVRKVLSDSRSHCAVKWNLTITVLSHGSHGASNYQQLKLFI